MLDDKIKQTVASLYSEIERRLMALPDGFSLAVSEGQRKQSPENLQYSLVYNFAELEPGVKVGPGPGRWTIYGPMTPELRQKAMALGLPGPASERATAGPARRGLDLMRLFR